jgi:hypothetical protein
MFTLPTHSFRKDHLRSLLEDMVQPNSSAVSLSPAALRIAKQWAIATNLIDKQGLTTEGRLVAMKDPYLEATVTDWLIHFHLSLSEHSLWNYFIYKFLPGHPSFREDELLSSCIRKFTVESPDKLKKSIRLILKTYTEQQAIANNKFLSQEKKRYSSGNPDLLNPYTIGYLLAKFWEREFRSQSVILIDQIVDAKMGLTSVLGITKEQLRQQLDILEKYEIIEQRSAKPHLAGTKPQVKEDSEVSYQVHRCWKTATEVLEKAYENDIATPNKPLIQSLEAILDNDGDVPDFSQFLEWTSGLMSLDGGSNTIVSLAS